MSSAKEIYKPLEAYLRCEPITQGRRQVLARLTFQKRASRPGRLNPSYRPGMHRWLKATINSWQGLRHAVRSEAAVREELAVLVLAVPLAFVIADSSWKRLLLIGALGFVLVVELLNTAIEKLADRVSREIDPQIGRVKDMGSAAVGISLLIAGAIWLLALAERFAVW